METQWKPYIGGGERVAHLVDNEEDSRRDNEPEADPDLPREHQNYSHEQP